MNGRIDGSVFAGLVLLTLVLGPLVYAGLRRLEVRITIAASAVAGVVAVALACIVGLASLLGARPWEWSATWGGGDWAVRVATATTLWWWPLAAAGALFAMRPAKSDRYGASVGLIALGTAWTVCSATPGSVAAGLVVFAIGICIEHRGGRLRIVACALICVWTLLELGADARAVGIEQPSLESLAGVARPYAREVFLVWMGVLGSVGLIPAHLGEDQKRSSASHLLALTLAAFLLVKVYAPSLALGVGEYAQILGWPAVVLIIVAATRQGTDDEHGGAFGVAAGLMVLGVGSLRTAGLAGASALPMLLGLGLVAQRALASLPMARLAVPLALSTGAVACIAATFWSKSTFETPGVLAVLAVVGIGIVWAGASRSEPRAEPARGRAVALVVALAMVLGVRGTLSAASVQRSIEVEAIARTRCLRLDSRAVNGLDLVVPQASCAQPDTVLRSRYRVRGHGAPGGGS